MDEPERIPGDHTNESGRSGQFRVVMFSPFDQLTNTGNTYWQHQANNVYNSVNNYVNRRCLY